jgi:hypothetical protein
VLTLRKQDLRNFLATLPLSKGVPDPVAHAVAIATLDGPFHC